MRSTQRNDRDHPPKVDQYELWSAKEIQEQLMEWESDYSDFVRVTTAQEEYGLPSAGTSEDCPYDEGGGCKNYIVTIQDFASYPEGSEAAKRLPQVLWSGEVHGNERVGPTAVMEAAYLLLWAADCESLPMPNEPESQRGATQCRKDLYDYGIDDQHRKWLARLVATRRIVIVPTANAVGYFRNHRTEFEIDPNRDFPYDVTDPKKCMQTIAGRTLNEVFRAHMFQLSLTFHGGTEIVGYEWGAPTWDGFLSPDHVAQVGISGAYSRFGGAFPSSKAYATDNMNDGVYPVTGGMEDWAYAGSWDPERVIECEPTTFGGYAKDKTVYDNSTLRVFNMLIECSYHKTPSKSTLGNSGGVMFSDSVGNGHIPRNMRLALLAADLVEPYVSVSSVGGLVLTDDVVPASDHTDDLSCQATSGVTMDNTESTTVEWSVGGALNIDETQLFYARWEDVATEVSCWSQPKDPTKISTLFTQATLEGKSSGSGMFSENGGTVFSGTVDLASFSDGDMVVVLARVLVDQNWADQPEKFMPNIPPQAHIVNARTNPSWYHEHEGAIIQGRLYWYSRPITIVIKSGIDATEELRTRLVSLYPTDAPIGSFVPDEPSPSSAPPPPARPARPPRPVPNSVDDGDHHSFDPKLAAMMIGALVALFCLIRICARSCSRRSSRREKIRTYMDDDDLGLECSTTDYKDRIGGDDSDDDEIRVV